MFSFGTIKLNTAFFGAVTIVKEQNSAETNLTAKMDEVQDSYEDTLKTVEYVKKMKQFTLIKKIIHSRLGLGSINKYMAFTGGDTEDFVVAKLRGFGAAENFLQKFRIRPSAGLLRNIHWRCSNYSSKMHQDKIAMH